MQQRSNVELRAHLKDERYFHGCIERECGDSYSLASVSPGITEYGDKQVARPVDHSRLRDEPRDRSHVPGYANNLNNLIQVADA